MASTRTHPEPQEMRGQAADVESQHVPGAGGEEHKKSAKKSDEPEGCFDTGNNCEKCSLNPYGHGSLLLPFVYCLAEQLCLYSRKDKKWFFGGSLICVNGGHWQWATVVVWVYFFSMGMVGWVAWSVYEKQDDPASRDWTLVCLFYAAFAFTSLVPVLHAFFEKGNFGPLIGKKTVSLRMGFKFQADGWSVAEDYELRHLYNYYRGKLLQARRLQQQGYLICRDSDGGHVTVSRAELTPDAIKQYAKDCTLRVADVMIAMEGTLVCWAKWAKQYRFFNNYCVNFSIALSVLIPLTSELVNNSGRAAPARVLLTLMTTHVGVTIALQKGLRSEEKFRAFRTAESNTRDLFRSMSTVPWTFRVHDTDFYRYLMHDIDDLDGDAPASAEEGEEARGTDDNNGGGGGGGGDSATTTPIKKEASGKVALQRTMSKAQGMRIKVSATSGELETEEFESVPATVEQRSFYFNFEAEIRDEFWNFERQIAECRQFGRKTETFTGAQEREGGGGGGGGGGAFDGTGGRPVNFAGNKPTRHHGGVPDPKAGLSEPPPTARPRTAQLSTTPHNRGGFVDSSGISE